MKRFAILSCALAVASAMGQTGAPSDVPRDHWAFQAVENLFQSGILKGYPDGSFKGSRPVSRFEMAGALDALVQSQTKSLQQRVDEANAKVTQAEDAKRQMDDLRVALQALRVSIDEMKRQREEVPALTDQFASLHEQLRKLRGDLQEMHQQIDSVKGKSGK